MQPQSPNEDPGEPDDKEEQVKEEEEEEDGEQEEQVGREEDEEGEEEDGEDYEDAEEEAEDPRPSPKQENDSANQDTPEAGASTSPTPSDAGSGSQSEQLAYVHCVYCYCQLSYPQSAVYIQCPKCSNTMNPKAPKTNYINCLGCNILLSHPPSSLTIQCPKCLTIMEWPAKGNSVNYRSLNQSRKQKKKRRDPNAPKRASNAYMIFCKERRAKLKEERPDLPFGKIGAKLGEMWRALPPEEKRPYENMASNDRDRHKKEMGHYRASTYHQSVENMKRREDGSGDPGDEDDDEEDEEGEDGENEGDPQDMRNMQQNLRLQNLLHLHQNAQLQMKLQEQLSHLAQTQSMPSMPSADMMVPAGQNPQDQERWSNQLQLMQQLQEKNAEGQDGQAMSGENVAWGRSRFGLHC